MRGILMVTILAAILAACEEGGSERSMQSEQRASWNACANTEDVPAWKRCLSDYRRKQAMEWRQSDENAALLLMLGTAFLNGYNGPPTIRTTCDRVGNMVDCVSR